MTKSVNIRELILGILLEVTEKEAYSHLIIRSVLDKYQYLDKSERAFITRVSEGTIENMILIDYIINQFSKVKVNKMKPVIRNILRMGVYQLKYMDSVPDSAVCNEAVKLAKKKGFNNLTGFVNGVLRNISRNIDSIRYPAKSEDKEQEIEYLSIMYSMPGWITEDFYDSYGKAVTKQILEGFLNRNTTTVRCNLSKASIDETVSLLEQDNINVKRNNYLDYALEIENFNTISNIKAFNEGLCQVQDVSSMLVAEIAGIKENDIILDVCAAPGGKSIHAADKLNNTGKVYARDLTEAKAELIRQNVERTGYTNIEVKVQDALIKDNELLNKADVVIADLPCSGLGVIAKKTDIKYKMSKEKQKELVKLQRQILSVVKDYVKPGGVLIYSTCTINIEENIENVKWFCESFDFEMKSITSYLCKELRSDTTDKGYLQLLPGVHNTDGFFMARLERK